VQRSFFSSRNLIAERESVRAGGGSIPEDFIPKDRALSTIFRPEHTFAQVEFYSGRDMARVDHASTTAVTTSTITDVHCPVGHVLLTSPQLLPMREALGK
jgi:hypothetical protein